MAGTFLWDAQPPFFQLLSLSCRYPCTNAPQYVFLLPPLSAPQLSPLPGIHAPKCMRLMECEKKPGCGRLEAWIPAYMWPQRPRDWQRSGKGVGDGILPRANHTPCTVWGACMSLNLPSREAGKIKSGPPNLQMWKLSPLPKNSELINRCTQILIPA